MTFLRVKTVRGRKFLYRQTSIRKGKKVHSIMEYVCSIGWIAVAATSPGKPGGYKGHKTTDARQARHQDSYNRERFDKEMENPKERFIREATKAAAARTAKTPEADKETMEALREFNSRRQSEAKQEAPRSTERSETK